MAPPSECGVPGASPSHIALTRRSCHAYTPPWAFDRLFSTLDQLSGADSAAPSYPPYKIVRTGESAYRISVAVARFTDAALSIEARKDTLAIRGQEQSNDEEKNGDLFCRGIAGRNFERSFQLSEHVEVKGASLENGLLYVDLARGPGGDEVTGDPDHTFRKVLEVKPTEVAP